MRCPESLRVQAYFDGELDALTAAEVEGHSESCTECRALLDDLTCVRTSMRQDLTYAGTPPALRARLMRALNEETAVQSPRPDADRRANFRVSPFWKGALTGIGGAAIAASIALLFLAQPLTNPLLDDLLNAHVRSLMPDHLVDVVSTDKHTVKPWFAGHADVSPVVADFAQQGYRLIGGRADYFDRQRAAVVVYQHGSHVINVFSWAATKPGLPANTTRNGYHLAFWRTGNLVYCAVSDTACNELMKMVDLLHDLAAQDIRE